MPKRTITSKKRLLRVSRRDDFPAAVKRRLRAESGTLCAKPDCLAATVAVNEQSEIWGGRAAHICAAAPRGPRYVKSMTPAQRRSADNGIWLCTRHGDEVDADHPHFSIEELHDWKRKARVRARRQLGERTPTPESTIATLTQALTASPQQFIAGAIGNVHTASERGLQALDPRFRVTSTYQEGVTHYRLHANEIVAFGVNVRIPADRGEQFKSEYDAHHKHGQTLRLALADLTFQGSELLEFVRQLGPNGTMQIIQVPKVALVTASWMNQQGQARHIQGDGKWQFGSESARLTVSFLGGLIRLEVHAPLADPNLAQTTLTFNKTPWEGRLVRELSYVRYVDEFFDLVRQGAVVIQIEDPPSGKQIRMRTTQLAEALAEVRVHTRFFLDAWLVCGHLCADVRVRIDEPHALADLQRLAECAGVIEGRALTPQQIPLTTGLTEVPDVVTLEQLVAGLPENSFLETVEGPRTVRLFGTDLHLPGRMVTITGFRQHPYSSIEPDSRTRPFLALYPVQTRLLDSTSDSEPAAEPSPPMPGAGS